MGLDIPDLDDRTYEEILEDALKRLPVHSDEWTDHNAHDPGITVLETLAWLAETYSYQLDRVTDAHRRKYLDLLGVRPAPPTPASVDLQLSPDDAVDELPAALQGAEIPEGEPVRVDDGAGFTGTFETTKPVTLTAASIDRVVTDHTGGLTDNTTANETYGMQFLAFGERAAAGDALYLGFDRDPFVAAEEDIVDVTVDYHDADLPEIVPHEADDPEFRPSVELAWQYCTDYGAWTEDGAWAEFDVRRDQTKQLYRGGTVALEKTPAWDGTPGTILHHDEEFIWIRCTVVTPGYEIPPSLNAVRMDIVPARHGATKLNEELVRPDGGSGTTAGPGQTFEFEHSPVLDAEITVGGEPWDEVAEFDASGPDDRHYVIDSTRSAIRFGNGVDGTLPAAGQPVVARSYDYGGGERGNVPRSSSCTFERDEFEDVPVSLRNRGTGGADAESLDAAIVRLRTDLRTPYRAVTLDDYRQLATQTPGLRFGRATALVGRTDDAAGGGGHEEVRVVVVPYSTRPKPQPSDGFLDAVRRHLDRHRLLTDRVRVEPPTYVEISVETTVRLAPGYAERDRIAAVESALDAFLDPLDRSGEDGWPFGRPVYRSELYEVIETVDGIGVVLDVSVRAGDAGNRDVDGNVLLGESGLPYPAGHDVIVEREPPGRTT